MALNIRSGILLRIFSSEYILEGFSLLVVVGSAIFTVGNYCQRVKLTRNGVDYTVFDFSNVNMTIYQ